MEVESFNRLANTTLLTIKNETLFLVSVGTFKKGVGKVPTYTSSNFSAEKAYIFSSLLFKKFRTRRRKNCILCVLNFLNNKLK